MKYLLAVATAALACGCASPRADGQEEAAFEGPGAAVAAGLGFHGPVERVISRNGN